MRFHFSYVLALVFANCLAQKHTDLSRAKERFAIVSSVGKSSFIISIPATDFASLESRLGVECSVPLNKRFDIITALQVGVKFKRESYMQGQIYSQPGFPLLRVNETASKRNHWLIEIPLLLQYRLHHPRLYFRGGISGRSWFPNNDNVDMLTARREFGLVGGAKYRTTGKFSLGVDLYEGITQITSGIISTPQGSSINFDIRNRSIQGSVAYHL